jgi:hypothetical protein
MTDEKRSTRRGVLRLTGAAAATAALPGVAGAVGDDGGNGVGPNFRVRGREIKKVQVRPEEVTVRTRKTSPALKKRYGFENLPTRDNKTLNKKWDARVAKAGEWKEVFEQGNGAASASTAYTTGLSYRETDYPYGVYEYAETDGVYEQVAPMNVISPDAMSDVVGTLYNNGYTGYVVQYNRSAFNSETWQFETQHDSAATGTFGFLGRKHAKFWEFEGYTSCSAHVDSSVPHEAISHEEAEQHILDKFDNASGWFGIDDYYDINNGSFLDHDGAASGVF